MMLDLGSIPEQSIGRGWSSSSPSNLRRLERGRRAGVDASMPPVKGKKIMSNFNLSSIELIAGAAIAFELKVSYEISISVDTFKFKTIEDVLTHLGETRLGGRRFAIEGWNAQGETVLKGSWSPSEREIAVRRLTSMSYPEGYGMEIVYGGGFIIVR